METSLHRELKQIYADQAGCCEVRLGGYRIDAVRDGTLIEIQHGSLAALRRKLTDLLPEHRVLVVKPIIHRKLLIQLDQRGGVEVSRRYSPKRGTVLDLFSELVYLARVFPHPHLTLEVAVCNVEELRYPRTARRSRRRRWGPTHRVADQRLVDVCETYRLATSRDLLSFLPKKLPKPFHTGHLAEGLGTPRWVAQKMAYCLRSCGVMQIAGKQGNAVLYTVKRRGAA